MKKKLLLFAMCLFAFAGNMMAKSDIYYKVDKTDIMQGKTAAITFYYDADAGKIFRGFQVEFVLPEGFQMAEGATIGADLQATCPMLKLMTSEKFENGEDGLPTNVYMGAQLENPVVDFPTGEDIELFTFYVKCDEDVELGEYSFTTTHLEFADMGTGQSFHCEAKTMTLNVTEYMARDLYDTATELPEPSALPEDVIVHRTIKANVWSTLTLPFDLPNEQLAEIFGDDVKIARAQKMEKNTKGAFVISFESIDAAEGIDKNYPYVIKVSQAMEEFKAKDVTVDADEENAYAEIGNGKTGRNYKATGYIVGSLRAETEVPEDNLFLRDNKFFVSVGDAKINAFRAFFDLSLSDYSYSAAGANVTFTVDGEEVTAIEGLTINSNISGDVYSVNGTYMGRAENVMNKLPRGIYIVNNKKVVVK
jgi:hypothetical protein